MQIKNLGSQGLRASQVGLGCMGMSEFYGPGNDEESLKTLKRAVELGITFWDTSDAYGPYKNEELIAKSLKGNRDKITLATKFGIIRDIKNPKTINDLNFHLSAIAPVGMVAVVSINTI